MRAIVVSSIMRSRLREEIRQQRMYDVRLLQTLRGTNCSLPARVPDVHVVILETFHKDKELLRTILP